MVLNKLSLENFMTQETLYTKSIRGNLDFKAELHMLDGGKTLQLYLYRNHDRILDFIQTAENKGMIGKQHSKIEAEPGVLRLTLNDNKFMINNSGKTLIDIQELNFNPKEISLVDFEKGKVAVLINFTFEGEVDNSKFKKEVKDYFMEEFDDGNDRSDSKQDDNSNELD